MFAPACAVEELTPTEAIAATRDRYSAYSAAETGLLHLALFACNLQLLIAQLLNIKCLVHMHIIIGYSLHLNAKTAELILGWLH